MCGTLQQAQLCSEVRETTAKVRLAHDALENDYLLLRESQSLIDGLSSHHQLPPEVNQDGLCSVKVSLNLTGFKEYLGDSLGAIQTNRLPPK